MTLQQGLIIDPDRIKASPGAAPIGIVDRRLLADRTARLRQISTFASMSQTARRRALGLPPLPPMDDRPAVAAEAPLVKLPLVVRPEKPQEPPKRAELPLSTPRRWMGDTPEHSTRMRAAARSRVAAIIEIVRETWDLRAGDIEGYSRIYDIARGRRAAIVLVGLIPDLSAANVARIFGLDHTTVLHAYATHDRDISLAYGREAPVRSRSYLQTKLVYGDRTQLRAARYAVDFMVAERRVKDAGLIERLPDAEASRSRAEA